MASTIAAGTTSGTAIAIAGDTSGVLQLQTNGTTAAVTIDTSQNVGIGVVPSAWGSGPQAIQNSSGAIWQFGSSNIYVGQNYYFNGTNRIYTTTAEATEYQQGAGIHRWFTAPSGTAGTAATFTERMRIDSSGFLLVNTTTIRNSGRISVDFAGNSAGALGLNDTDSANGGVYAGFLSGGTFRGSITNNNNTAVAYNTTSDYRLKENIAPMTGALSVVQALKPVTYKWKSDGSDGQGFIAHELQAIVPESVTGEKDAVDADGNPKYQGVDTSFLVATLTAAIQELNAKVDAQAVRIAELEGAK